MPTWAISAASPIRIAWLGLVMPGLLLNYFGQGALIIADPTIVRQVFFELVPKDYILALVALATFAAVIASQAVITGVFSLTRQAIQLGYLPRMEIQHTSETAIGQIYLPRVNWILMGGVVALVVGFGSSGALAGAYGIAVTGAMMVDAALATAVAILVWRWPWPLAVLVFGLLAMPDVAFFIANALKIPDGGWLPLVVAAFIFFTITTWRRGRALGRRRAERRRPAAAPVPRAHGARARPRRRHGGVPDRRRQPSTPAAFLHNLKHNKVLHERIIILQVETMDVPRVAEANRVEVERLGKGFYTVIARYGFTEQPDVPAALRACRPHGIAYDEMETSFFLGRETLVPEPALQARQMAPRLVHLAVPFGLGDQDLLPHPAEPRYRTGQPDPGLDRPDAPTDARSAARPAQHAPGLRAPDRGPVRHRRRASCPSSGTTTRSRDDGRCRRLPPHRRPSRLAAFRWAATSPSRSCDARPSGWSGWR